jgi:hypothetical protein
VLFRPGRVLVLVAILVLTGVFVMQFIPNEQAETNPSSNETIREGGLVEEQVMQQFSAIEAKQRQWDSTVWADELTARDHGESVIQIWDRLLAGADPFELLTAMPVDELKLGNVQSTENWESDIRYTQLGQEGPTLSKEQFSQALNRWKIEGWKLEQSEWRHREFIPRAEGGARSTFWISFHLINTNLNKRGILRGDIEIQWQSIEITPETLAKPKNINLSGLDWIERDGAPAFKSASIQNINPNEGNVFIDPVILTDFNGDGMVEIILGCKNQVYRNHGNGRFKPEKLCPKFNEVVFNVVLEDLSGDGVTDVVTIGHKGIYLIEGKSNGTFPDEARLIWSAPKKVLDPMVITTGDIDNDGDADLWFSQYKLPYVKGQMPAPIYDSNDGFPGYLLINDGNGNLTDRTKAAGLETKRYRRSYSASFVDLDDDHDLDLVVISDFSGTDLYLNNGSGNFSDATSTLIDNHYGFGMAHNFGDYDANGKLDLIMIGMNSWTAERLRSMKLAPPTHRHYYDMLDDLTFGNRLYFGGNNKFEQRPMGDKTANTGWSWGATSFDADNDGDTDLFIANGHKSRKSVKDYERQFWCHDIYHANSNSNPAMEVYFQSASSRLYGAGYSYGGYEKNRLLLNRENKDLDDVAFLMNTSHEIDSRNVVSGDIDGDGRLDLIFTHFSVWPEPATQGLLIARNLWPGENKWIGFRLAQSAVCPSLNGTKVRLRANGQDQWRFIVNGDSYRSQHAPIAHFGLKQTKSVEEVEVHWPDGKRTKLKNPAIGQYHNIQHSKSPDLTNPAE